MPAAVRRFRHRGTAATKYGEHGHEEELGHEELKQLEGNSNSAAKAANAGVAAAASTGMSTTTPVHTGTRALIADVGAAELLARLRLALGGITDEATSLAQLTAYDPHAAACTRDACVHCMKDCTHTCTYGMHAACMHVTI